MKDEKKVGQDAPLHHSSFIIHPFLNVPRRGLGEAVHLGFRVFGKASRRLLANP